MKSSHLEEEGIPYFKHLRRAWRFSRHCFVCAIKGFVHGVVPDVYKDTSGELEEKLERFVFDED